jgi:hypothetical protein
MQRLLKCCLRAAFSSAVFQLPAKGTQALRAACGYSALVRHFIAHRYSAAAGDALREKPGGLDAGARGGGCEPVEDGHA